jgi:hypothetical protein
MFRSLLALGLLACGSPQPAEPLPGTSPPPTLDLQVSLVSPGEPLVLSVEGLPPGDPVWFVRGAQAGQGPCPPSLGGCLGIRNATVLGEVLAGVDGVATFSGLVPETVPVGRQALFQAAAPRTDDHSAVVAVTVTPPPHPDFQLADLNPTSPRYGDQVSPRDYLEAVSGWYFGHAT